MTEPYWTNGTVTIYHGDNRQILSELAGGGLADVALTVTSPPYNVLSGLAGVDPGNPSASAWAARAQAGRYEDELPEEEYRAQLSETAAAVRSVTAPGGAMYWNHKCRWVEKRLVTPADVARDWEGWRLNQEIIWARAGAPRPGINRYRVTDERILWLSNGPPGFFDNRLEGDGTVWRMNFATAAGSKTDHPVPFPPELPWRAILSNTQQGDLVLDPYAGSGTTLRAAARLGRRAIGVEREERFCEEMAQILEAA